jgi:hypothetical protein
VETLLFHEPWWLAAVTDGRYQECIVKQGTDIVGRLPYLAVRLGPFRTLRMPPFTHVLGPAVNAGAGKPQTRLIRRLSITRSLIDQLPSSSYFLQQLDPSLDDGLANADGLAFQERRFAITSQPLRSIAAEAWTISGLPCIRRPGSRYGELKRNTRFGTSTARNALSIFM